ncbi:Type II secretion system F domain protein [Sulfobacillus acidophilus DSM 10332]|uniref:Type II secretion system F domain protein n=1 Tax=Sulfobacillus acidophilus (strain ATCC 700253 / DSM 10332 / NAL) TaxID=679936 RepID=G8TS01_SULAD|nr:Type II secretion system F domain protein [Sulfobacillus acidophilus DSM 10332]
MSGDNAWLVVMMWPIASAVLLAGIRYRRSVSVVEKRLLQLQRLEWGTGLAVKKLLWQRLAETWSRSQNAAAFNLRWTEYSLFISLGFLVPGILGYLGRGWAGGLLLGLMGGGSTLLYFRWRKQQYLRRAQESLPDFLRGVASGLRAGSSLMQSMLLVSEETPDPLGYEIQRVLRRESLGFSLDQALEELTQRIPSKDLSLAVMAINIQREVGGSLADILENIVGTIRERQRLAQEVRSLTAQGRYSGWILAMLPFILGILIWFVNPSYMDPLFGSALGHWLVGAALFSVMVGSLVIHRMVKAPEL